MAVDSFLRLLQFSDGLFPAGGYAHSFGLETLAQSGRVRSQSDVAALLRAYLESSAAPVDAVAALCARKYALKNDLEACLRLDRLLEAFKPASELRQASRQMGRQALRVLHAILRASSLSVPGDASADRAGNAGAGSRLCRGAASGVPNAPFEQGALAPEEKIAVFIARYAAAVESGDALGHHPIVFGFAAAAFDWPPRETAGAFLYSTCVVIVGAALRLLPLGQLAGQFLLAEAGTLIAALSETILDKDESDLHSFSPELEIAAMRHESLDARLFRS